MSIDVYAYRGVAGLIPVGGVRLATAPLLTTVLLDYESVSFMRPVPNDGLRKFCVMVDGDGVSTVYALLQARRAFEQETIQKNGFHMGIQWNSHNSRLNYVEQARRSVAVIDEVCALSTHPERTALEARREQWVRDFAVACYKLLR